jgi:HSP20 family molecular chaperone IbpA
MPIWLKDFERAIDEFFDDVLISRWRQGAGGPGSNLRDAGDHYEIELATPGVDPANLEIEASGNQLTVRDKCGSFEGVFAVPAQIATERARARWSKGVLRIVVPKRRRRKIPLEKP